MAEILENMHKIFSVNFFGEVLWRHDHLSAHVGHLQEAGGFQLITFMRPASWSYDLPVNKEPFLKDSTIPDGDQVSPGVQTLHRGLKVQLVVARQHWRWATPGTFSVWWLKVGSVGLVQANTWLIIIISERVPSYNEGTRRGQKAAGFGLACLKKKAESLPLRSQKAVAYDPN